MNSISSTIQWIRQARDIEQLWEYHQMMPTWIRQLDPEVGGATICQTISSWHDQMMIRVIKLAKRDICEQWGQDLPPFVWLLFGSSAREEPTFWTDQDNGLIYSYPRQRDPQTVDRQMQQFVSLIVTGLHQAGYPLCEGNVMATNPVWCHPLQQWQRQLDQWITKCSPESIRSLMIVSDLRPLFGERYLYLQLMAYLLQKINRSSQVLDKGGQFIDQQPLPLGVLGHWLTVRYGIRHGTVQLKQGGYHQLVGMVRLFSLVHHLRVSSTQSRIQQLADQHRFFAKHQYHIHKSLDTFLSIRLSHHLEMGNLREQPEDYIVPSDLSKKQQREWKQAIGWVKKIKKAWHQQRKG